MNKEDDDTLEDVNSLMKMIGGKKKDAPPGPWRQKRRLPATGAPASDAGDFSALMKKLGMANKPEPAPAPAARPAAGTPPPLNNPPGSLDSLFSDTDDQAGPAPAEPARPALDISGKDMRETLGKMLARGSCTAAEAEPAPVPQKPPRSGAGSPASRSPARC